MQFWRYVSKENVTGLQLQMNTDPLCWVNTLQRRIQSFVELRGRKQRGEWEATSSQVSGGFPLLHPNSEVNQIWWYLNLVTGVVNRQYRFYKPETLCKFSEKSEIKKWRGKKPPLKMIKGTVRKIPSMVVTRKPQHTRLDVSNKQGEGEGPFIGWSGL